MVNINDDSRLKVEKVIKKNEKKYNYRTSQWEIGHICRMFGSSKNNFSEGELFVPSYQRQYVWSDELKCKFIESLFLNIPIPYIFVSENEEDLNMEIIDGYQRIRTIYEFFNNGLELKKLEKLKELEGFKFLDLSEITKTRFLRKLINIVIFESLEMEQKQEMFSRINTTSNNLEPIEKRKGTIGGDFYKFMKDLSKKNLFKELCPLSDIKLNREEDIELILRFFAYTEWFESYNGNVDPFLTNYMRHKNEDLKKGGKEVILKDMGADFDNMLNFIKDNIDYGFRKTGRKKYISSRAYYEALSVGVGLALKEGKSLNTTIIKKLLKNENFNDIVSSDGANAVKKFRARINAVKEALLLSKLPEKSWK